MREFLRKIVNYGSYEQMTERLLTYRNRIKCAKGMSRFFLIRKYTKLLKQFNADIPLEAEIGEGLVLPHGANGIFISRGAVIGSGCVIFQQVTIGSNTLSDSKHYGTPVIKDNVYIGAGAKIIGKCTVGNNCRIGANAVVTSDVPDNTTVVLGSIRFIKKDNSNNSFVKLKM